MTDADRPMSGKVCLVTGATSGIGLVTSRELAKKGATVVMVGRDRARTEAAVRQIRDQSGNPNVEFLIADLSSQAEVRRLADEFLARHDKLHVLLNNAGAIFLDRHETNDGIERTFALNHLAYFLLTNLLLDTLKASAPARVVSVASDAHKGVKTFNFDDPQGKVKYKGMRAYCLSKLANILFSSELARRLEGTSVTSNSLHPGFVATNFLAGHGALGWIFRRLASVMAISPEKGARTSIYLASSPEVEGVSGGYFEKELLAKPSPGALDEAAGRRLWELSEQMTGLAAKTHA